MSSCSIFTIILFDRISVYLIHFVPFSDPYHTHIGSTCPFASGDYQVFYSEGKDREGLCRGDESSILTVDDKYIIFNTCEAMDAAGMILYNVATN